MMKKVGFKKYTIFLLVCFFALCTRINAARTTESTIEVYFGEAKYLGSEYEGFQCDASSLNLFNLVYNNDTGLYQLSQNRIAESSGTETFECWYDYKKGVTNDTDGTIKYTIKYAAGKVISKTVWLDLVNKSDNVASTLNASKITNFSQGDGDEYLDVTCTKNTANCSVTIASDLLNSGMSQEYVSYLEVEFTENGSTAKSKATVKYIINTYSGAYAWVNHTDPNPIGTCSFGTGWSKESDVKSNGHTVYYYATTNLNSVLPNCTPNTNSAAPIQFDGWVNLGKGTTNSYNTIIGSCPSAQAPGSITLEAFGNYVPCYSYKPYVQLVTGGEALSSSAGWDYKGNYTYLSTNSSATATIVLPSVNPSDSSETFKYWVNQKTGATVNAGTAVPYDGTTYQAYIESTNTYNNVYKSVYLNQSFFISSGEVSSCSVDSGGSTKVSASMQNGECVVGGLALTTSGEYIPVRVTYANGSSQVYHFSVVEDNTLESTEGSFIIDLNPPTGEEDEEGGTPSENENTYYDASTGTYTNECTKFLISGSGKGNIGQTTSAGGGTYITSTIYKVNAKTYCPNDENEYIALCLDPGRKGPAGDSYLRSDNLQGEMKQLVKYIVTYMDVSQFNQKDNAQRIASHMAARIVGVANGYNAETANDLYYKNSYEPYRQWGKYHEDHPDATVDQWKTELKRIVPTFANSSVCDTAADILANFNDDTTNLEDEENYGFTISDKTATTSAYGSTGYKINYSVKITSPPGVTDFNLELQDKQNTNGADFGVSFSTPSCSGASTSGSDRISKTCTFTITASNTANVKIPSEVEESLLAYKLTFTGGEFVESAFIAVPEYSKNALQRMIVFNLGQPSILMYFSILPTQCELPGLDKDDCNNPESTTCNKKLFKAAGCCEFVPETDAYEFLNTHVCGNQCTVSTLPQVCSYDVNNLGQTDLYEISDGAFGSGGSIQNNIAECIVNTEDFYKSSSDSNFDRYDDAGNLLNVTEYEGNQYCEVTCKEDWQITMDSFGNYAGENAVAAGHYFQIVNNDIFMYAKRTCYSSYVDYEHYANDLVQDGKRFITAYNNYSNASHAYADYDEQTGRSNWGLSQTGSSTTATRKKTCTGQRSKNYVNVGDTDGDGYDDYEWDGTYDYYTSCSSTYAIEYHDTYYTYRLDINHKFSNEAGQGKYTKYTAQEKRQFAGSGSNYGNNNGNYTVLEYTQNNVNYTDSGITGGSLSSACSIPDWDVAYGVTESDTCEDSPGGEYHVPYGSSTTALENQAFSDLKSRRMSQLEGILNTYKATMENLKRTMQKRVEDLYDCQHFQLDNTSDASGGTYADHADTQSMGGALYYNGGSRGAVKIETMFEPYAEYEYAEKGYMSILLSNKENYLEQFDSKNDKAFGSDWSNATNDRKEVTIKINGSNEQVNLSRNYMEFKYYTEKYADMWELDSGQGREYEGSNAHSGSLFGLTGGDENATDVGERGYTTITVCAVNGENNESTNDSSSESEGILDPVTTGYKWEGGSCYEFKAPYLAVNYVSASIENSSFYKNQGIWYGSVEDLKEHGENLQAALNNAVDKRSNMYNYNVSKELSSGKWSPIGLFNVFPISITTPRNLYTYTYEFSKVGSYYDGDLGRIMGGDKPIIEENTRTCFYEVFEELCLCCGDKINTYIYDDDLSQAMLNSFVNSSGYGYQLSDINKIETNVGGTLSFATSSVNLSDMGSVANRDTATNWSENSAFTFGGETNLTTGKGAELMSYIESQGETIYSKTNTDNGPEYAYYLTPATLSSIREYNEQNSYGINYDQLVGYGRYSIASQCGTSYNNINCWNENNTDDFNNKIINFQHYGSKFLENLTTYDGVVVDGTLATPSNTNVCYVVEGDVDNIQSMMTGSNPCRWIDYIEYVGDNSEGLSSYEYPVDYDVLTGNVTYFRLAFK